MIRIKNFFNQVNLLCNNLGCHYSCLDCNGPL